MHVTATEFRRGVVTANGKQLLDMEFNTRCVVSIVNVATYREKLGNCPLQRTNLKLQDYNKAPIPVICVIEAPIAYAVQKATLPLVVVKGDTPNLFGRNWLAKLQLNWKEVVQCTHGKQDAVNAVDRGTTAMDNVPAHYAGADLSEGMGPLKFFKGHVNVKKRCQPCFPQDKTSSNALRDTVEAELDQLEKEGIIKKCQNSRWASPTVNVAISLETRYAYVVTTRSP